jgi:Tetracyclin repressor-like, C-terminal domain
VRFALQTPGLYRIATMGEGRPGSDVDLALASSAFMHVRTTVQSLMDEGVYAPDDPTRAALELWTAAHGVAALLIAKPYLRGATSRGSPTGCCGRCAAGRWSADWSGTMPRRNTRSTG